MPIPAAVLVLAVLGQTAVSPAAILSRYVQAIGGEAALRAVKSRITEGDFDNGRGLRTRYRVVEEAPNSKLTQIGTGPIEDLAGSGRGFDGAKGWDKSFIGTGLRRLDGRELADAAEDADFLRPLHLLDGCSATTVDSTRSEHVIVCAARSGGTVRHAFDKETGLLTAQDVDNGRFKLRITYDDYRSVEAVKLPFRTHLDIGGTIVQFHAASVRLNQPIDRAVFQQPRQ